MKIRMTVLMKSMSGRSYGWGNFDFYNDRSAEMRILMMPFGIFLGYASNCLNEKYNARFLGLFMATVTVHGPRCQSAQVYRHGQNPKGHARFCCRDCHRLFQLTDAYEAPKPGVKKQITEGFSMARDSRYRQDTECRHQ